MGGNGWDGDGSKANMRGNGGKGSANTVVPAEKEVDSGWLLGYANISSFLTWSYPGPRLYLTNQCPFIAHRIVGPAS